MLLDILVDAVIVGLVDHTKLNVARLRGKYEIERVAQNISVGNGGDGSKVEESERLLETPDNADGCEEEIACRYQCLSYVMQEGGKPSLLPL